jgi:hypothetical protein
MKLERAQEMDENLLRKELERLISIEKPQVAINQAMDYLRTMPEKPINTDELLELMMQTEEIYELLTETKGLMKEVSEELMEQMTGEYEEKTLMSFLEDLMNWEEKNSIN